MPNKSARLLRGIRGKVPIESVTSNRTAIAGDSGCSVPFWLSRTPTA